MRANQDPALTEHLKNARELQAQQVAEARLVAAPQPGGYTGHRKRMQVDGKIGHEGSAVQTHKTNFTTSDVIGSTDGP